MQSKSDVNEKIECELREKISWVSIGWLGRDWHVQAKQDAWKSVWKMVKMGRAQFNLRFKLEIRAGKLTLT